MQAYLNGAYIDESQATVSIFDRGFLYGDTLYETMRTHRGRLLFWPEHRERLRRSIELAHFEFDPDRLDLPTVAARLIALNDLTEAVVRVTISRGLADRDQIRAYPHTWAVTAHPLVLRPEEDYRIGVAALLAGIRRNAPAALDPAIKAGNWLNNLLARREARLVGAVEGVMLSIDGYLAEGASSNLFWVSGGVLETPAVEVGILHGVTRAKVLAAAQGWIETREVRARPDRLAAASEIFLTSTTWEVLPVTTWNGAPVGGGTVGEVAPELRRRLQRLYDLAAGEGANG
ncbi:MAG: aminotransferase class IV [Candidatus Eisenbacteria bacterium]|nr:aminotransferase class IV [Candidatus Eisenbacteria bacterium]MCC7141097.1 aminotransferase class IV [Candidatus Eisenbacteria bacterium]